MNWFEIANEDDVPSPSLLVYPDRVEENIRRMVAIAGGATRLRTHVKTHKLAEVVRLQMRHGITKFKCATIAECEMTAGCGAPDVLLAFQPVGPNVNRLIQLVRKFPGTKFSCIADDAGAISVLSEACEAARLTLEVLLDIDVGMKRSGVEPGEKAVALYRQLHLSSSLLAGGLHVYDGHLQIRDPAERAAACDAAFAPANALRRELTAAGLPVPNVVAGGTPTFPIHARRPGVECSPGTSVFSDCGYSTKMPDLDFPPAAVLLTRVISRPGANRLCLDLGHKAVAAENPHPRVNLFALPEAKFGGHSEEHLVVETERAGEFPVGTALYGVPWHICPTVALHGQVVVVQGGRAVERWNVTARERVITV